MKLNIAIPIFYLMVTSSVFLQESDIEEEQLKKVQIQFIEVKGAKSYEIEWLFKRDVSTKCKKNDAVIKSPFTGIIPIKCDFFRMRSVAIDPGPWTDIHKIPQLEKHSIIKSSFADFFLKKKNKEGEFILKKRPLDIAKITLKRPLLYILNDEPLKPYLTPITFTKGGLNILKIYTKPQNDGFIGDSSSKDSQVSKNNKDNSDIILIRTIKFWVDVVKPKSELVLFTPFYFSDKKYWLGATAKIKITGSDKELGVEGLYYRIRPELKKDSIIQLSPPFVKYNENLNLADLLRKVNMQTTSENIILDFYAKDFSGNISTVRQIRFCFDIAGPKIVTHKIKNERLFIESKDVSIPIRLKVTVNNRVLYTAKTNGKFLIPKDITQKVINSESYSIEVTDHLENKTEKEIKL